MSPNLLTMSEIDHITQTHRRRRSTEAALGRLQSSAEDIVKENPELANVVEVQYVTNQVPAKRAAAGCAQLGEHDLTMLSIGSSACHHTHRTRPLFKLSALYKSTNLALMEVEHRV